MAGSRLCLFVQEKTCEESTSFDLTPYDVASAVAAVDRLLVEKVKESGLGETVAEDFNVEHSGENLVFTFKADVEMSDILEEQ